jgi:hypothetical protein
MFLSLAGPAALGQSLPADELMTAVFKDAYHSARKEAYAPMARNGKRGHYIVKAKAAARMPNGTVVLVLSGVPARDAGSPEVSRASGGLLSVCFLSGKALLTCRENVAELGVNGEFGDVHFISLGEDKPALAITHGGAVEHLAVFALEDNHVHNLTRDGIRLSGGKVKGAWRLDRTSQGDAYRPLEIEFTGTSPKGSVARYEVVKGQYKLVKGRNPIPAA